MISESPWAGKNETRAARLPCNTEVRNAVGGKE